MRRALPLFLLLCLPATGSAMWARVPLEELVQESDLIVIGTLRDVTEHTTDETDYGVGRIEVREVIWGNASAGDSLALKWDNANGIACTRVEHRHNANVEGIWLLTRVGDAVQANYPGRFVELSERKQVERSLRNSPVVLRADNVWVKPGEPMRFSVVYRNASDTPRDFPGLAFENGSIRLSPGRRLAVTVMSDDGEAHMASRLSGRVLRDASLAPVTVPPRGEYRAELDLREMLAAEPGERDSYDIKLKFDGLPPTNELGFYVDAPLSLRPTAPTTTPMTTPTDVGYRRRFFAPYVRRGLAPLTRAGLTALFAMLLFPFFKKLRSALDGAGRARV